MAVYLLELDIPPPLAQLPQYLSYLAPAEGARWRGIRPAERQWQYLQSRVLRRVLLAAYTGREAARLHFARDEWGRTLVADHRALYFSLTQCASHVAIALGSQAALGLDAETVFPVRPSFLQIARSQFSQADLLQILTCPEPRRYGRFLELWTLRQAYLKALGRGRAKSLSDLSFSRASSGLLLCRDRTPQPTAMPPMAFLSEKWVNSCQLALAYRAGQPVSLHYLNGSQLRQDWPHTQAGSEYPRRAAWPPPLS